jgi:predicted nucleotidyltransferase
LPLISLARRLVACLEAHQIEVEALYLFGSQARGEATPSSDIDLVLRSPSFATQSFWTRCARVGEALGGRPEPVQIDPVSGSEFDHSPHRRARIIESIRPALQLQYCRPRLRIAQVQPTPPTATKGLTPLIPLFETIIH